jgi:hypothetical protein
MRFDCLFGQHKPVLPAARNQGFQFSRCRGCGRDMVRSGRSWRRVPKGFRVVWRKARSQARPGAAPASAATPSVGRQGMAMTGAGPLRRRGPFSGLADLVRAAMRVLLWSWNDRVSDLRVWMRALPARPKVLRLPSL